MKTKNIKQTATFTAKAQDVYEALMDAKKHAAFTGANAKIDKVNSSNSFIRTPLCHHS